MALEIDLGQRIEQFRAVPVNLGKDRPAGICALYGSDAEIDPYRGMFFFPKSTLKMVLFDESGKIHWIRDIGPGVVPGVWFAPIFAWDHDGNGVDEIYHVNNTDPGHPMNALHYVLERVSVRDGSAINQWSFPQPDERQATSRQYRHFIFAGKVHGSSVLATANGTYGPTNFRAFNPDMSVRWELNINSQEDGMAAGAHMCAIVDINEDGVDEVMWGERALSLQDGSMLFCAGAGEWDDHSDIVQPVLNRKTGDWGIWTAREKKNEVAPRLVFFDGKGKRLWSDVERGHMDTGWSAHFPNRTEPSVFAIRMVGKRRDADGEHRTGVEEFVYSAFSGEAIDVGFDLYTSLPVDLDGDGFHELVKGYFEGNGNVLDANGRILGETHGHAALVSKFTKHPGEQILCYRKDGKVLIYRDANAVDGPAALDRYQHPFYLPNQKLSGVGYNYFNLGGL